MPCQVGFGQSSYGYYSLGGALWYSYILMQGKYEEGKEGLADLLAISEGDSIERRNQRLHVLNDMLICYKISGDYKEAFACAQRICSEAEALMQTGSQTVTWTSLCPITYWHTHSPPPPRE